VREESNNLRSKAFKANANSVIAALHTYWQWPTSLIVGFSPSEAWGLGFVATTTSERVLGHVTSLAITKAGRENLTDMSVRVPLPPSLSQFSSSLVSALYRLLLWRVHGQYPATPGSLSIGLV
jgi:hypothetical protein